MDTNLRAENHASAAKAAAARSSVLAAVGLTAMKIVVGLLTGSLGVLAEAAHSALDLVAALMTWFAVRLSDRPADREHTYGHGKVENLSALFETGLLLAVCAWIVWEAVDRLFFHTEPAVEATVWAFAVMIISIAVDVSRSRMLYRVARTHNSQALEADALHFSTDIWSSAVVVLGLACVAIGRTWPAFEELHHADALAALLVAAIVIVVSARLGMRTIAGLLDAAPAGMRDRIIAAVEALPGIANCHRVRMRMSGPKMFVDIHVLVDGDQTLRDAHRLTETIELTIEALAPEADVTVHPEPLPRTPGPDAR